MNLPYIFSGFAVGLIVGLTGVGGGSLMTPILLWFGIPPAKAVGTDLLYAAITKAGGVFVHHRQHNIDWRLTGWLALGSVPASLITLWVLHALDQRGFHLGNLITHSLGIALLLTATAILLKKKILSWVESSPFAHLVQGEVGPKRRAATVVVGLVLGVLVTLSSIGAGALGTVALFVLYPRILTVRLVGTEIAHAVPLTLVAGLGHAGLGNVNWILLASLLVGSLPGIFIGSKLSGRLPETVLRPMLALMLATVGAKFVF